MKPIIVALALGVLAWGISMFHPFGLAMPWQSGDSTSVNLSLQQIMGGSEFELVESDWGRRTPFNYVAATATLRGTGQPSATCSELRAALDAWGQVTDTERRPDGCVHEAVGTGPQSATIEVTEVERRRLRIEVRVQHVP